MISTIDTAVGLVFGTVVLTCNSVFVLPEVVDYPNFLA